MSRSPRIEFGAKVKLAAWERAGGCCEDCGVKIVAGQGPEYDHEIEAALGGEASIENCRCLCTRCHRSKTSARAPVIAKAARLEKKAANIRPRRQKLPGSKDSGWKAKIGGGWVRRDQP